MHNYSRVSAVLKNRFVEIRIFIHLIKYLYIMGLLDGSVDLFGLGSLANAAVGAYDLLTGTSAKRQRENSREIMALQQQYNLENMEKEQQYAKELFDYESFPHQMELAAKAGINPAMLVSQGNLNLGSQSSAKSGQIDAAGAYAAATQMEQLRLQQQMQIAQIANINSQTELNKSNKKSVDTNITINKEAHEMNMKLQDYDLKVMLPSKKRLTDAQELSLRENLKLIQPQIDNFAQTVRESEARVGMLSEQEKELRIKNSYLDTKEKLAIRLNQLGCKEAEKRILLADANYEQIKTATENLVRTGKLMDFEIDMLPAEKSRRISEKDSAYWNSEILRIGSNSADLNYRLLDKYKDTDKIFQYLDILVRDAAIGANTYFQGKAASKGQNYTNGYVISQ